MKRFLKRLLLFLSIVLVITIAIDKYISREFRYVYDNAWGETETWNTIFDHQITDSCLIYGSSRASIHIDPLIIEEKTGKTTYNFGQPSQIFHLQRVRHRLNVRYNGYPKYIIYSLDPLTFTEPTTLRNKTQFLPYMLWNEELREELIMYPDYGLVDYYIPAIRYFAQYDTLQKLFKYWVSGRKNTSKLTKGYEAVDMKWKQDFDPKSPKSSIEVDPRMVSLFEEFIEECKTNNTALAIICTPEYIGAQELITNRDSIINTYRLMSDKYNLPFLDYSKDSLSSNTKYLFNSTHLNTKGATILSERIANDLTQLEFFK